ncbi:histidinol dehydrogenase, partial [Corallococcus soli]
MSAPVLKYQGALAALTSEARRRLLERGGAECDTQVAARVQAIIARVREEGDRALFDFARQFDRVELEALEVPRARWDAALESLPSGVRAALERAARNIARAHAAQRPLAMEVETEPGVVVGRRPDPLGRVGVYAPGGRAVYPSSVLM